MASGSYRIINRDDSAGLGWGFTTPTDIEGGLNARVITTRRAVHFENDAEIQLSIFKARSPFQILCPAYCDNLRRDLQRAADNRASQENHSETRCVLSSCKAQNCV